MKSSNSKIEMVEYICSIFKLDNNNTFIILDVVHELEKINSFDTFRNWLKDNLNHFDTQYMNSYQKFMFLISKYLQVEFEHLNQERISESKKQALLLANKVKATTKIVEELDTEPKCENFKTPDGSCLFTVFEMSQIRKLGGIYVCVQWQKSVSGRDALVEKFEELFREIISQKSIAYQEVNDQKSDIGNFLDSANIIKKM